MLVASPLVMGHGELSWHRTLTFTISAIMAGIRAGTIESYAPVGLPAGMITQVS